MISSLLCGQFTTQETKFQRLARGDGFIYCSSLTESTLSPPSEDEGHHCNWYSYVEINSEYKICIYDISYDLIWSPTKEKIPRGIGVLFPVGDQLSLVSELGLHGSAQEVWPWQSSLPKHPSCPSTGCAFFMLSDDKVEAQRLCHQFKSSLTLSVFSKWCV